MDDYVNVSVRIKPNDGAQPKCLEIISKQPAILLVQDKSQTFHFDNIFSENVDQEDVYNKTVKRLVEKVKDGYNCTIFAYGQTGTGKTYTIGTTSNFGNDSQAGLISRALNDFMFFPECEIEISFIEIYNEKVFDLLDANNKDPLPVKGFSVQGVQKMKVDNTYEALQMLETGNRCRHTGETKQNLSSSRSHAIFSIHCCIRSSNKETVAKLNLVDLAGSESIKKTGNQGTSLHEGININRGLLSLGQVMTALSSNSNYIPYRQSIVTTILKDSLDKKNFVSLIACVNSNVEDLGETLQTLEFANRVKKLKNKPEVNEVIIEYKKQNPGLFVRGLTPLKRSNLSYETPFSKPKKILHTIQEPVQSVNNSNFDISPLFSSSMASSVHETSQNFSPVIRKYMDALQNTIISKIEDTIHSTLRKKPPKVSLFASNKENLHSRFNEDFSSADNSPVNLTSSNNSPTSDVTQSVLDENSTFREENVFKMPAPRKRKANPKPSVRRSSVRLQEKRKSVNIEIDNFQATTRRRSVRIQMKEAKSTPELTEEKEPKKFSPCANCRDKKSKKREKSIGAKDSPMTKRTKHVLDVLNNGSLRDLEKLQTVGVKTAEKILIFRQMKGKFKTISEIAELPYLTQKKFDKFLAENFLRI